MSGINPAQFPPEAEEAIRHANDLLDWFEAFNQAWIWCEDQGMSDGLFGAEYRRVAGQALVDEIPNSQAALRGYIGLLANMGPIDSVTQQSLRAREIKRLKHPKGD
jgi:hypothetical protein